LDYGFGTGQEAIYFAENGYDVYGVKISPIAQRILRNLISEKYAHLADRIKTLLIRPEDKQMPFEDDFFDYIHSNQVIYHLPSEPAIRRLIQEWYRVLRRGGGLMFSTVGPQNSIITKGREVSPNVFELDYESATTSTQTMRAFLTRDEATIRDICVPFEIEEIGWFTNHYCGVDGFHWQVLARKPV
jgi:SAM-dependent methyltransferase